MILPTVITEKREKTSFLGLEQETIMFTNAAHINLVKPHQKYDEGNLEVEFIKSVA